jgi:hypothetical protein
VAEQVSSMKTALTISCLQLYAQPQPLFAIGVRKLVYEEVGASVCIYFWYLWKDKEKKKT